MKGAKWLYVTERPVHFYLMCLACRSFGANIPKFRRWLVAPFTEAVVRHGDEGQWWFPSDPTPYRAVSRFYLRQPRELRSLCDAIGAEYAAVAASFHGRDRPLRKLSDRLLWLDLRQILYLLLVQFQFVGVVRRLDEYAAPRFRQALGRATGLEPFRLDRVVAKLTASPLPSYHAVEQAAFWRGVRAVRRRHRDGRRRRAATDRFFRRHLQSYAWVNESYAGEPPLRLVDLRRRLKQPPPKPERRVEPRRVSLSPALRRQARALALAAYTKDYLRSRAAFAVHLIRPYLRELSRRSGVSAEALTYYTPREFRAVALQGRRVAAVAIRARQRSSVIVGSRVYVGKRAALIARRYFTLDARGGRDHWTGRTACVGRATGPALVARDVGDLKSAKGGVILIVPNTNPAFVPYLAKVRGIVAEEGGLTTHVSLVAREFRIPTVVGVAGATRAIRDGERLEVDATNGTVRRQP